MQSRAMSRFAQGIAHMKKMEGKRDRDTNKSIGEELPSDVVGKCAFLRNVWHADLSKKCLAVMDRLVDPESTMDYDSYNSKHRLIDNILGNIGKFHGMDFSHDDGNSMYENKKQTNRVPVDAETDEYMSELLKYQPELFHDIVGSGASGSGDKKKDNGDSSGSGGDKGQEAKEDPEEEGPEPEDGGDIEILVKTPPGKTITIGVAADFKIIMMKAMVKQSAKYPVHEQKLMFGVSELQNDDTVAKSGLVNGSMVDLLLDLTGGAEKRRKIEPILDMKVQQHDPEIVRKCLAHTLPDFEILVKGMGFDEAEKLYNAIKVQRQGERVLGIFLGQLHLYRQMQDYKQYEY